MNMLICLVLHTALILSQGQVSESAGEPAARAVFIWHLEAVDTEGLESLKEEGFNTLYAYLSESNKRDFSRVLENAESLGLDVYALNGSYEWLDRPVELKKFMELVKDIEEKHNRRLKGVVLDIEPYVLNGGDEAKDYAVYLQLLDEGRREVSRLGLKLNIVVPFWYDKLPIEGSEKTEGLLNHVMKLADEVTVMAYRNRIEGTNGIYALIREELIINAYLQHKLIIALETLQSKEGNHVTYAKMEKADVLNTIESLSEMPLFQFSIVGFAVHDWDGWSALD